MTSERPLNKFRRVFEVVQSGSFKRWLFSLRDLNGRARILRRLERLTDGHAGDHKSVGDGVMELRLTFGPGYRVYYQMEGRTTVLLLAGGDKSSQVSDIARAKAIAAQRKQGHGGDFHPF